jgi:aspartate aminotransferase-like enzyme
VRELGLELFADPAYVSNTVTGVALPDGVSAKALVKDVREATGIEIGAGQGKYADVMLRIGHMGWCDEESLRLTLDALGAALRGRGVGVTPERGAVANPV